MTDWEGVTMVPAKLTCVRMDGNAWQAHSQTRALNTEVLTHLDDDVRHAVADRGG